MPVTIPAIAPSLFIPFEKMPNKSAGKNEDAANPKANATVLATKVPGGLIPNQTATRSAPSEARRAHLISSLSVRSGFTTFFIRSCEIEVESTRSSPAAVESAAAIQPAMSSAMTHFGKPAMRGFAITIMSFPNQSSFGLALTGSLVSNLSPLAPRPSAKMGAFPAKTAPSFPDSDLPGPKYWILPSPFLSIQAICPVSSKSWNHAGASLYEVSCSSPMRFTRAKAPMVGAVR